MDNKNKEILAKLVKVAENQQKILNKLAQAQGLSPQSFEPKAPTFEPARQILARLEKSSPQVRAAIRNVEVHPAGRPNSWDVKVLFNEGKASQAALNTVMATVTSLQKENVLTGASYQVSAV